MLPELLCLTLLAIILAPRLRRAIRTALVRRRLRKMQAEIDRARAQFRAECTLTYLR